MRQTPRRKDVGTETALGSSRLETRGDVILWDKEMKRAQ